MNPSPGGVKLGVVIPMYNEQEGAARCIRAVLDHLAILPGDAHLVVVDDGSSDMTRQILDELGRAEESLRVVHHETNRGYGAALKSGAEVAHEFGADWVLFMDSDLTNPPSDISRFSACLDGPFDLIKASRYMTGGDVVGVPWKRRIVSVVGNHFARLFAGWSMTDATNGFRAIRTDAFLAMPLMERGFSVIMEETYWAWRTGLRFTELPTILRNRDEHLRPTSFLYRPSVIWAYGRFPLRAALDRVRLGLRHLVGEPADEGGES